MKYKLRSSSKNSTESKSTYHSSGSSSSRGISSGPPEKRPRLEHEVQGPNRGVGHNLRRKPWAPSLISIETQTDDGFDENYSNVKSSECVGGSDECINVCELCGCRNKRLRYQKSEGSEVGDKEVIHKEEEFIESDRNNANENLPTVASISERLDQSSNLLDNGDKATIKALPLEVILHVMQFLDAKSMLCMYQSCKWYFNMLIRSNAFWKMICVKEELANYSCISEDLTSSSSPLETNVIESSSFQVNDGPVDFHKDNKTTSENYHKKNANEETGSEDETTARGISGSSLNSYPTGRTSKRRKSSSCSNNKIITLPSAKKLVKKGFADHPMHGEFGGDMENDDRVSWHRVYLKGLQMRRNIVHANFEGWRIYANSQVPVTKLNPDLDFNADVKQKMMNYPKLSVNDDLKIDWDDHHLVVFHFFRGDGESCTIRVWDISGEPKFLFAVEKGIECITDKVFVVNGHVVIVPSWPIAADAIVMTLAIEEPRRAIDGNTIEEAGHMSTVGKFRFCSDEAMTTIDENWEHTQLRVVRDMAMVVIRSPNWQCLLVKLPSCELKHNIQFDSIPRDFDCQQIRSYKNTAMILFNHKLEESSNQLVTIDVGNSEADSGSSGGGKTRLRSIYACNDTVDVALFTDPEEIYLMKRNGDVVIFDPNTNTETIKIANPSAEGRVSAQAEYQLFVNRKEQICVMQSAAEVSTGRNIKVYSYNQELQYTINLDIARYGMSRDESICIYTNGAFLAAADSKKFAIFNVKTGKYLGELRIPSHLERSKGKEEKYCMFEQTGLSLFIFDEDKLITVHDYERSFPAVLDIYKFW